VTGPPSTEGIPTLGWQVLVHQPLDETMEPVRATAVTLVGTSSVVLVLAGLLALALAQLLIAPLRQLKETAQQIAEGDLTQRLNLNQSDEIGRLAASFDQMAEFLEDRIFAEQSSRSEAQRLQQLEADNRRQLEQAVGDYLTFTQQVAEGELGERLPLQHTGSLGQLALGLNAMVASLLQARTEADRLQQAETETRERLEQAVGDYLTFVQEVARGNLSQRLAVEHGGALGQLEEGLNIMVESLRRLTSELLEASSNIARSTAEILSASTQQSATAAQQSAAITQTMATVEEVKSIARQTASRATSAAEESQTMIKAAVQGTQAVEQTVEGMAQIRQRVEDIAETILALSGQTQAIGMITQTVNELADQSNLLALNAAIEAARAGEQGKSFAIVAQHVRDLAERSKLATAQIREILGEVQQATNAAVMVTEEGTKGVEAGARLAGQAGQVIHRIVAEVESGAQANVQMAAAAQQQTAGMEQIGQAMASIQQATSQTLASTRQAERAAQDLNSLAQSLKQTIAAYRL
jgi:methyl-accepting chemotaxis protein